MSCSHRELFSCEDCIKEAIRADFAKNGPSKPVFERLRDAQKEVQDLKYKLAITEGQRDNESGVLELVAEQRDELLELVKLVAKSQTTDEAWEASERCYDYLDSEGML